MPPDDCWPPAVPLSARVRGAVAALLASLPGLEIALGSAFFLILAMA